jgi:hypothetical protein
MVGGSAKTPQQQLKPSVVSSFISYIYISFFVVVVVVVVDGMTTMATTMMMMMMIMMKKKNVSILLLLLLVLVLSTNKGGSTTAFVALVDQPCGRHEVRRLPAAPAENARASTTLTLTTTTTTSTRLYSSNNNGSFKLLNRQQSKVEIDPVTGLYRPIRKKDTDERKKKKKTAQLADQWDGLKEMVYDGVDIVKSVPKKVQSVTATTSLFFAQPPSSSSSSSASSSSSSKATQSTTRSNDYNVMEGYAKIEEEFRAKQEKKRTAVASSSSRKFGAVIPGDRILNEYKETRRVDNDTTSSSSSGSSSTSSSSSKIKGFDAFKERLYDSVDAASNLLVLSNKKGGSQKSITKKPPLTALEEAVTANTFGTTFKPAVRARQATSSDEVLLKALDNASNINNKNPIQKLTADIKVRELAWKEEARQAARQRQAALDNFKERFYQASDAIVALPKVAATTTQNVVQTTRQTMDTVKSVPAKIQQQADAVQQSIQASIQTTKNAIETVKSIPERVQTTVSDIKEQVQTTAQTTQATVQKVTQVATEVSTTTKVWLGLEKPKPKPPKSLPPPSTAEPKITTQTVLQGTARVTGKVAWFLGKESVALLGKFGQLVVEMGSEALQQQQQQNTNSSAKKSSFDDSKATTTVTINGPAKSIRKPTRSQPSPPPPPETTSAVAVTDTTTTAAAVDLEAAAAAVVVAAAAAASNQQQPFKMPSDEELRKKDEDMKRLELEIEEALRLANDAIQSSVQVKMDDSTTTTT